jgi:hypothetical protein
MAINISALWPELLNVLTITPCFSSLHFWLCSCACAAHAVSSPMAGFMLISATWHGRPSPLNASNSCRDGRLCYRFKTAWRNGTTHAVFTPLEFLEKLCALVPTPRAHLVRFSGLLGPAAKWRSSIVPPVETVSETSAAAVPSTLTTEPPPPESNPADDGNPGMEEPGKRKRRRKNYSWAELIQRVFAADVTVCGKCGGRLRLISPIHPPVATRKILDHLGLPSRPPPPAPAARDTGITPRFDYA